LEKLPVATCERRRTFQLLLRALPRLPRGVALRRADLAAKL